MSLIEKVMEKYNTERIVEVDEQSKRTIVNYFNQFQSLNYKIIELAKIEAENCHNEISYHYIICLNGGNNGNGSWQQYFIDLAYIMNSIHLKYQTNIEDIWLIKLDNDVLDDVHNVYIGLKMKD